MMNYAIMSSRYDDHEMGLWRIHALLDIRSFVFHFIVFANRWFAD